MFLPPRPLITLSQRQRVLWFSTFRPALKKSPVERKANPYNLIEKDLPHEKVIELRQAKEKERATQDLFTLPEGRGYARASGAKKAYTSTLYLPKTKFEIRAKGATRQHLFRKRTTEELYRWQASQTDRPAFVLHDGPPYANGDLHMGHSVNKILKDIINRYQLLRGKRIHYVPGWDCHGLPIEQKAGPDHFPGMSPRDRPADKLREVCKSLALKTIEDQKADFEMYAMMADWSDKTTYRTLDVDYESRQFKIFGEMVRKGLIFRANRPVFWSPSSLSALAEAELSYDKNYMSRSVYGRFPLTPGPSLFRAAEADKDALALLKAVKNDDKSLSAAIWTTTPWSLPGNMALNINPELSYSLVQVGEGQMKNENFIIASDLIESFQKIKIGLSQPNTTHRPRIGAVYEVLKFPGSALLDSTYRTAFMDRFSKERPILPASYVTAEAGTGVVHSAPGHGLEDYQIWQEYCKRDPKAQQEKIISPIDDHGRYTTELDDMIQKGNLDLSFEDGLQTFRGLAVLGTGGKFMTRMLRWNGFLIGENPINHTYPRDWRTKQPIIVRATPQWFADLGPIKEAAAGALEKVRFVPESGRVKLQSFVRKRGEWCISRQRPWGVPIPVLYDAQTDEPLLSAANVEHIARILKEKGTDYWWAGEADEFVEPQERSKGKQWIKGMDTMDVWFDSGSSWSMLPGVQEAGTSDGGLFTSPSTPPADVYLEGSDQHRGWFQSSLLTYIATSSLTQDFVAPYKTVFTHGFTVDKKSKKMSKSEGNVISPNLFLKGGAKKKHEAYGADVLRWWIARSDCTRDIITSALVVKQAEEELRKLRNTCRFLLASLPLPDQVVPLDRFEEEDITILERYMLQQNYNLNLACRQAYDDLDFAQVIRRMTDFVNRTLSSFYFGVAKDSLYADAMDDKQRQIIVSVLDQIFKTFTFAIAPVAPHLAEEVYHFYRGATRDPTSPDEPAESFFTSLWQDPPSLANGQEVESEMNSILHLKEAIFSKMEEGRQGGIIKASLEAQIRLFAPPSMDTKSAEFARILLKHKDHLARIYNVSYVDMFEEEMPEGVAAEPRLEDDKVQWPIVGSCDGLHFIIEPSRDHQCPRCWSHTRKEEDKVCSRCHTVLEARGYPLVENRPESETPASV